MKKRLLTVFTVLVLVFSFTVTCYAKNSPVAPVITTKNPNNNGKVKIIYDLNGGKYKNKKSDIVEYYKKGTVIKIHKKPTRKGYTFTYWKGSSYQPGDKYKVVGNHTFVAQWKKNGSGNNNVNNNTDIDNDTGGNSSSTSPQTGNSTTIVIFLAALAACCGAFTTGTYAYKKNKTK